MLQSPVFQWSRITLRRLGARVRRRRGAQPCRGAPLQERREAMHQGGDTPTRHGNEAPGVARPRENELGEALALLQILHCVPVLGLRHADFVEPLGNGGTRPRLLQKICHIQASRGSVMVHRTSMTF
jgi:hypothetical protein